MAKSNRRPHGKKMIEKLNKSIEDWAFDAKVPWNCFQKPEREAGDQNLS